MGTAERRPHGWRQLWEQMRIPLCAFAALAGLAAAGILMVRDTLLENAYNTGTALAASCAAEEEAQLAAYETLLSFGTASLDTRVAAGESRQQIEAFLSLYFQRLDTVLGEGVVDPYVVLDGEILAANPWEGDAAYDASASPWYQQAAANPGKVIFTPVYTDAIYHRPVVTAAQQCAGCGAVMAFDILPAHLELEASALQQGDSFFLCDSAGALIYQETDLELPRQELEAYLAGLVERIADGSLDADPAIRDLDGQQRGVYYTRLENGWYSIVTVSHQRVLGKLWGFSWTLFLMFTVSFLAVTALAWRQLRLDSQARRAGETAQVLGNSYYALYRVDYERETYEMIKGSDYVRGRIPSAGPYADLLRTAGEVIEAEAFRDFTESFSCANIRDLVRQRVRDFGGDFLRRFGEEYRWVSVRVLYDASLAPGEVVLCFREVEREKQAQLRQQRLLEESLQLARQNEAAKQAFFRNMSHDMRTPLNAILGSLQLARQHLGDPQRAGGYLARMESSARYLLELINDILEMARMEHGQVQLESRPFDLGACVEECLGTFRTQAEAQGKTLEEQLELPSCQLVGDPFRIQQILNNLLSNAFKFTPAGGRIRLEVRRLEGGEHPQYKFVVADTGIGMSPAFLQRVFEPYAREMRFSDRQAAGTGLGMSITKNLVAQMGGEIQVESAPGQGSTFTVVLPLALGQEPPASAQAQPQPENPPFRVEGLCLLVAEDNEINLELATELLEAQGARVLPAENGAVAVERFRQSQPFAIDAILMDMQMPVMDGCEAARQIRALDRPDAGQVAIVAVTANAFAEDLAATAAAGMDAHISKPIDWEALRATLERLLANR